ncbi:hypothetical protein [Nocardioides sp. zg-1228]|uniref:hypothetical protein n=1 Tax=Nocardioides sp. zg-1228 TaxID=2763008 RepID=UPI001642DDF7|nr:hypothetical protein [Nocardioides sp. zg-1228]MBC2932523.1 hypothetical protein [Nocardioides sp. zg-1228]QSF58023.1 hypothetical protein JX575_02000 [Nocardioides sp. zg-1228]
MRRLPPTHQGWPQWASRVHAELEVASMMSLSVYSDDVAVGQAIAAHLALVTEAERQIDQLGLGMHDRLVIGQALGVLMERLDVAADQKVVDPAAGITRTRRLVDLES